MIEFPGRLVLAHGADWLPEGAEGVFPRALSPTVAMDDDGDKGELCDARSGVS